MAEPAPKPRRMREPLLHTQITDCLPYDHPWAWETVHCLKCNRVVHSIPNENMASWVETGKGAYCLKCFAAVAGRHADEDLGLPDG